MNTSRSNHRIAQLLFSTPANANVATNNPHSNLDNPTLRRLKTKSAELGYTSPNNPQNPVPQLPKKIVDHRMPDNNPSKVIPYVDELERAAEMKKIIERFPYAETFQLANGNAFEASGSDANGLAAAIILLERAQKNIVATGNEISGKRTNIFLANGWCYLTLQNSNLDYWNSFAIDAIADTVTPELIEDANYLIANASEICRPAPEEADAVPTVIITLLMAMVLFTCAALCWMACKRQRHNGAPTERTELLPATSPERHRSQ